MDNDKPAKDMIAGMRVGGEGATKGAQPSANLPKNEPFTVKPANEPSPLLAPIAGVPDADAEPKDRNSVFAHLVKDDGDIAGLVAYSIYKQHKLDWLTAFEKARGRAPNDAELASYITGEGTPRRLATYRHLAEATLAGNGLNATGGSTESQGIYRRGGLTEKTALTTGLLATYALIAVLFLIGFLLAAHYTMSSR